MNCERCREQLEDFLYGELSQTQTTAIRDHLRGCVACHTVCEDLEHEQELFTQYYEQSALEPAPEMWEAIRARIGAESSPVPRRNLLVRLREWSNLRTLPAPVLLRQAIFAALLVIISVTATALYFRFSQKFPAGEQRAGRQAPPVSPSAPSSYSPDVKPSPPVPPASAADSKVAVAKSNPGEKKAYLASASAGREVKVKLPRQVSEDELIRQQVARAAREYQSAIRLLEQKIARRRDELDPTLVAQFTKSIELIDKSIGESRRMMRERPGDATAGQYLLAAYAKKVELMQEIALH